MNKEQYINEIIDMLYRLNDEQLFIFIKTFLEKQL